MKMGKLAILLWMLILSVPQGHSRSIDKISVVSEEWPGYTGSDGKGLYWDIVKAVFEPQGIAVDISTAPWKRAKQLVRKQSVDAYVGDYFYPEESNNFVYPVWHISIEEDLVIRYRRGELQWSQRDAGALANQKIAWVRGYDFDKGFLKDVAFEKVEVDSIRQGVLLLEKERIDALIDYRSSLSEFVTPSLQEEFANETVKQGEKLFLVFSKTESSLQFARLFDNGMESLVSSGRLEQIYAKYDVDYTPYQSSLSH